MTAPAPAVSRGPYTERRGLPGWAGGLIGILGLILAWQVIGATIYSGRHVVPTPTAVLSQFRKDGWDFYFRNLRVTGGEALVGWLWGNGLAIVLGVLAVAVPWLERVIVQIGIVSYCIPIVAVGSLFVVVFSGKAPEQILAAMAVFFTTLVGMMVGLRAADATALDVVHAYGGGSWQKMVKVRLRACLPSLFAALRIAAPAAILGAIIGEYVGAESGIGVAMINSQQALEVERTWGIAIAATALASAAYGLTALVGRLLTPWARTSS